jgi:hypothetical protein
MRSRLSRLLLSDSHVTLKFFSEISESSSEAGERMFGLIFSSHRVLRDLREIISVLSACRRRRSVANSFLTQTNLTNGTNQTNLTSYELNN